MRPRTSGGKQQPRCFRGLSHRESAALPVGWALEPTRIQPTDNRQATAPLTADHTALETQLLHSKKTLRIMRLPGRLVQLVRILGRHPRGRRFESCTAHQRHFKVRGIHHEILQRKGATVPFLCWSARPDSFFSTLLRKMRNKGSHTPDYLVASSPFARYTSRLRYGLVFFESVLFPSS